MSRTRLRFDIQSWIPKNFQPFWHRITDHLPKSASAAEALRLALDDADMRSIFVGIHQAHAVLLSPVEGEEYSYDEKSRYCRTFWVWIIARLHHRYLDAAEALGVIRSSARNTGTATHMYVQAYISLVPQCYDRICVDVEATNFGQIVILSANSTILDEMREVLSEYERTAAPSDFLK